jgi:hypothetical protein
MPTKKHNKKQGTRKIKKLNCNPLVKKSKISNKSCMTPTVINKLKESWNTSHADSHITSTAPVKIWKELKHNLAVCEDEKCWLKTIKDEKVRSKLEDNIFAPDHPSQWHQNPAQWLTNADILNVLKQYDEAHPEFQFIGPTPIDFDSRPYDDDTCVWKDLCNFDLHTVKKHITKFGIVFNLDKHNQSGSHWTSMFVDLENNIIFYFDSTGANIPPEVRKLVKKIIHQGLELDKPKKLIFHDNHKVEHQFGNNECGMYSLYFIITMLTGQAGKKKITRMDKRIEYFKTKRIKDEDMFKYRKIYFNS